MKLTEFGSLIWLKQRYYRSISINSWWRAILAMIHAGTPDH